MLKSISLQALRSRWRRFVPDWGAMPPSVWKRAGALNTWGTNAIEGNTLSHEEVERLLLLGRSVAGHTTDEIVETIQHEAAFRRLPDLLARPIDLPTVLEMHEAVFRGAHEKRPGQWRVSNVTIAGTRHRPPRRERVVAEMEAWVRSLDASAFRDAARMHHRFEQVHPFEDGNGRVGRLLLNLYLMQRDWPPLHILPPDRDDYLNALEAGNHGDLGPLEAFLRRCMARSLLDLLDQVGGPEDELRPLATLAKASWCPHRADYLALRCRQDALAGLRVDASSDRFRDVRRGRPHWLTSEVALRAYLEHGVASDPTQ